MVEIFFDFDACPNSDIYPCNRSDVKKNNNSKGDSYTNIGNMKEEPIHPNRRVRYAGVLVDIILLVCIFPFQT